MTKRTLITRAFGLAPLIAAMAAATTTTAMAQASASPRQDFCVIGSVTVLQACPSTINPALASSDGFMAIHMDNQKKDSPVAAYWQALILNETVVGSVSTQ